jgi:hypothetical protein
LSFDQFEANLKAIIAAQTDCSQLTVVLDPTLTSLFLLDLEEFCEFALKYSLPITPKLMVGNESEAGYLRCEFLPQPIRARLIDRWRSYYTSLPTESQALLRSLKDNLELAESIASFSPSQMQLAARQSILVDKASQSTTRFDQFLQRDQGVYVWWKSLAES